MRKQRKVILVSILFNKIEDDEQIKPHDLGNEEGWEPNQLPEELKENKIDKNSNENLNKENEIDNNPVKGHLLKTRPVDPILTK